MHLASRNSLTRGQGLGGERHHVVPSKAGGCGGQTQIETLAQELNLYRLFEKPVLSSQECISRATSLVANFLSNFPTVSINHKISAQVTENRKHTLASGKSLLFPSPLLTLDFASLHLSLAFLAEVALLKHVSNLAAELRGYKVNQGTTIFKTLPFSFQKTVLLCSLGCP